MAERRNRKRERRAYETPEWVDGRVNALLRALTHDLGRPFDAGMKNARSVVRGWCPLVHGALEDLDVKAFKASYMPAHFLDRYFYSSELSVERTLKADAWEKFQENLGRGYLQNDWKLRFLPVGRLNSVLESAALEIGYILGEFSAERMFELCEHGPNASVGVSRDHSFLDVKMTTFTGSLHSLDLLRDYLEWNTNLGMELKQRYPDGLPLKVVEWNQLSFVPKKFDKLRTMMVEPVVNQFFQQGLGNYIAECLKRRGNVDLSTQPVCHRLLCKAITKHGLPLATVDWSEASDRIWLGLVERLLPPDWLWAIKTVRSSSCRYVIGQFEYYRKLTMVGSMGCGFTFPLQTLIFLTLLRALAREGGHEEFVSVFGDDCIVDSVMVDDVKWLADSLGWKLNIDKSFWTGEFRESCGVDAFRGMDTRPVFVERPASSKRLDIAAWAYGCYNRVVSALAPHFEPVAVNDWIYDTLEAIKHRPLYVPPRFSEESGIRVKDRRPSVYGTTTCIDGSDAFGWNFKYLAATSGWSQREPWPYYLNRLSGKGVPKSFKSGTIDSDESTQPDLLPNHNGEVPGKLNVRRFVKAGFVHTWDYPFDPVI